jgi:uncharacterized Zn-finger protein
MAEPKEEGRQEICPYCKDTGVAFTYSGFHSVMEIPCPYCSDNQTVDEDEAEELAEETAS